MTLKPEIKVVKFDPKFAGAFADLNYEWIEKAYTVEDHDREILDNPFDYIIQKGGQIFFALADGEPAGTVALIAIESEAFELAKMAVAPNQRGRGIGDILMRACIDYATGAHKRKIVLESNTKQVAAINLYRKFGFSETSLDPNSPYARANIRMELAISQSNR